MPEMSRTTAGHGSEGLSMLSGLAPSGGRMGSMLSGINNARMHSASLEHDKWKTVTNNQHEERMAVVNHVLGEQAKQNDHGRHKEFLGSVLQHSENATPINATFGDTNIGFTRRTRPTRTPKGSPSTGSVPPTETPAAAPETKTETPTTVKPQKYAHRDVNTNKITHYEDQPQVMPTKKATKTPTARATAKKAASKKKK